MRPKAMFRWYLENTACTLLILGGVMAFIWGVRFILHSTLGDAVRVNGLELSALISLFVMGITLFSAGLRFGLINGVSRRTVFTGFLLSSLVTGGIVAVFSTLMMLVDTLCFQEVAYGSLMFGGLIEMFGLEIGASALLVYLTVAFVLYLSAMLLGYPIAGVFYRLGRVGRVVWAAGLPIGLCLVVPAIVSLLPAPIQQKIGAAFLGMLNFLAASPLNMLLFGLILSALCAAASWLLLRRAPLKAAA